jgi:uncharacterized protein YkwD
MAAPAISQSESSAASRLFDEVNSYRLSKGASPVQRHAGLDRLAQEHSNHLRRNKGKYSLYGKYVSHDGLELRATSARELLGMASISENVAAARYPGADSSRMIVDLWKNSKDHHKNMLDKWTHSGMGIAIDSDGMVFATQLFATKNNSRMTMRDRMTSF